MEVKLQAILQCPLQRHLVNHVFLDMVKQLHIYMVFPNISILDEIISFLVGNRQIITNIG